MQQDRDCSSDNFSSQALMIPIQMSYPFIANLSGLSLSLMLNFASILINVLSVSSKAEANSFLSFSFVCIYLVAIYRK